MDKRIQALYLAKSIILNYNWIIKGVKLMILLIGGTFDYDGGKRSKIFDEIIENFDGADSRTLNGGFVNDLFNRFSIIFSNYLGTKYR